MTIESARMFYHGLKAVASLHSLHAAHRTLTPDCFWIVDARRNEASYTVLAELGSVKFSTGGQVFPPSSNNHGRMTYLAPELECQEYGLDVDVWSLGLIGYELTYGPHPCRTTSNPWRRGASNAVARQNQFRQKHRVAIDTLIGGYTKSILASDVGPYIHREFLPPCLSVSLRHYISVPHPQSSDKSSRSSVGPLLADMLTFQWADRVSDRRPRISVFDALANHVWLPIRHLL